ncbi:hypothetical protein FHS34_001459 [Streptomyces echinatus]|uniref:Uncharacterized protein n=1 Tax=Streptomyces echinatus TaxID=67293 RepID=A0A7W9PQD2_9ACTN|nr:hypothetical protein [Streptomyces echinatus]
MWPAWEVREHGGTTAWFHVRLAFRDGAGVDALAVLSGGCVSIEDVRAQPALSLADLTVLADWIGGPLAVACGVPSERNRAGDTGGEGTGEHIGRAATADGAGPDAGRPPDSAGPDAGRPPDSAGPDAGRPPDTDAPEADLGRATETDLGPATEADGARPVSGCPVEPDGTQAEVGRFTAADGTASDAGCLTAADGVEPDVGCVTAEDGTEPSPGCLTPAGEGPGVRCPGPRRARRPWPRGVERRRLVAEEYRAARDEGADPVLAVMDATGLSRRRSLRLIAQARDAGFLAPRHARR